jgi:hypothetical protein
MKLPALVNGIGRGIIWLSGLLAIAVLVLAVRSFWRYDEIGYYTWQPNPPPNGRDWRGIIASHRGALFIVHLETDLHADDLDWYGGEAAEVIVNSGPWASFPANAVAMSFQTIGRWVPFGFKVSGGLRAIAKRQWTWRGVVPFVPRLLTFALLLP